MAKINLMYTGLLHTHSMVRYLILLLLVVVIIKSFIGLIGKKPYQSLDNKLSLYLFIATHVQLLVGLILYFVSPWVRFSGNVMADSDTRYWTVEHLSLMLVGVVFITMARVTSKKLTDDVAKHKRMFVFNTIALIVILVAIMMSKRGIF